MVMVLKPSLMAMNVGEFVHGLSSKGIYIFANGDKYEGEFERNLFNGEGVPTFS